MCKQNHASIIHLTCRAPSVSPICMRKIVKKGRGGPIQLNSFTKSEKIVKGHWRDVPKKSKISFEIYIFLRMDVGTDLWVEWCAENLMDCFCSSFTYFASIIGVGNTHPMLITLKLPKNPFWTQGLPEGSYVITHVCPWSIGPLDGPSLNISETALGIFLNFCMKLGHH